MMNTAGFYKFEEELLRFAPNAVYAPNFTLFVSLQETYTYPIEGWYYFATTEDAESFFAINGQSGARWIEFGATVQASPAIKQLMLAAFQQQEIPLAMGLGVGLGKAADGDARVFLSSWTMARGLGLIPDELLTDITSLAQQHQLPADFIAALGS